MSDFGFHDERVVVYRPPYLQTHRSYRDHRASKSSERLEMQSDIGCFPVELLSQSTSIIKKLIDDLEAFFQSPEYLERHGMVFREIALRVDYDFYDSSVASIMIVGYRDETDDEYKKRQERVIKDTERTRRALAKRAEKKRKEAEKLEALMNRPLSEVYDQLPADIKKAIRENAPEKS